MPTYLAPITTEDTATTNQKQSVIIDILSNDLAESRSTGRDDDGKIATNSVQIPIKVQ